MGLFLARNACGWVAELRTGSAKLFALLLVCRSDCGFGLVHVCAKSDGIHVARLVAERLRPCECARCARGSVGRRACDFH